jgi:predicted phage terminase large subunit-like protein
MEETNGGAQSGYFESGVVHIPQKVPWVMDFVHEITSFPFHKFDDQVDAVIQGLAYLRNVQLKHRLHFRPGTSFTLF